MPERISLPVLPLRGFVVFPGVTAPIQAGRPGTLKAIESSLSQHDRLVFAVAQSEDAEDVTPEALYTVGTIARIGQVQRGLSGTQLLVTGEKRGIAVKISERDGYLEAVLREAEDMAPINDQDPAFLALYKELRERANELGERSGLPSEVVQQVIASVEDPGRLADLVSAYLDVPARERQMLLEIISVEERLRRVLLQVQRQLSVMEAQEDIKAQVREELGDRQREMLLREQLKAIQKELGEDDGSTEVVELRQKVDKLALPAEVRKEVERDLSRLGRMNRESMEAQVLRTHLETIAELPWGIRSDEHLDLARAQEILDEDHFGLDDVKDRVLEFLAVRKLRQAHEESAPKKGADLPPPPQAGAGDGAESSPEDHGPRGGDGEAVESERIEGEAVEGKHRSRGPILLFAGPPGVGKTSIAKSIARAMGRKYVRISLGGVRDEADIRGHRRTYVGAMAGRIIQGMRQAGTMNPVFLLDEVDKLGASFQGDPASALLEVLDPAQNDTFTDHYLGVPFDLSEVLFIATANFIQGIPQPLLDRMEAVTFSGYTEAEKLAIARQYLVPRQLEENGLGAGQLTISDEAISEIISRYTREAGVRQLERELGKLARKIARQVASGAAEPRVAKPETVRELLGRPRIHPEKAAAAQQVGVATGMFYTPVGGDIMFVEATTMPGKGDLVLTGQLGDVMKESGLAAWSYARSHTAELNLDEKAFEQDIHVHVPAGAIPKDGPSAGVTLATAMVSALSGRPSRHDIAMTGEITLTGRVLPIGGVKEKILGAVRAGITSIILPKDNVGDLQDLSDEVRSKIEVHPVESLGEVLALTLEGVSLREGRLLFSKGSPKPLTSFDEGVRH